MNVFTKSIRKLVGWCPCAKIPVSREWNCSHNFETPARPGDGKSGRLGALSRFSRPFSRFGNQILLVNVLLTLNYLVLLAHRGINPEAFLEGLLFSLLLAVLLWKKKMQTYDALAKKPIADMSDRKKFLWIFPAVFLLVGSGLFSYITRILSHNTPTLYSFFADTLAFMWITFMWILYLQIVYWERKNHMRIYTKSEGGFRTIYSRNIRPEGKGELK